MRPLTHSPTLARTTCATTHPARTLRAAWPTAGHYPDQLLAPRASLLLTLYRAPFDFLEQVTTGLSDGVLVNSRFTLAAFQRTFSLLAAGGLCPRVLYPCIDVPAGGAPPPPPPPPPPAPRVLLSINRFERKKEVGTALRAFAAAIAQQQPQQQQQQQWHLVLAGGYDTRVAENVEHFEELCALAASLGLLGEGGGRRRGAGATAAAALVPVPSGTALPGGLLPGFEAAQPPQPPAAYAQVLHGARVTFIRSFSDAQKAALLSGASAVAYTPPNEHFGIVPLECMAAQRPVLCDGSGGPLESVVHGSTGWLCSSSSGSSSGSSGREGWQAAVARVLACSREELQRMGVAGRAHVEGGFSRGAFARTLEGHCQSLVAGGGRSARGGPWMRALLWLVCALGLLVPVAGVSALAGCVRAALLR